jgi:hypothetical protein
MEKWFCLGGMGLAGLFLILFLLDLIIGIPFSSTSPTGKNPYFLVDLFGLLSSAILGYLGYNAYRDLR